MAHPGDGLSVATAPADELDADPRAAASASTAPTAPQWFASFCAGIVLRLPFGLAGVVPPTLVGFGLISGTTFSIDLMLLTALHDGLGLPVTLAFTLAYGFALSLAFVLNRVLNFRSREPVGRQTVLYVVTVAANYGAFVLGVGAGLTALGVDYQLARVIAGLCEAAFMYATQRWVVFRPRKHLSDADRPGGQRPGV